METNELQLTEKSTGRYKSAYEFIEALKPQDMLSIIRMCPSEKLKIFKSETNIEYLEKGLEAMKQARNEYLKRIKEKTVRRDNDLIRWNKNLVEDAESYLNDLKTKEIIKRGATQSELDNFLKALENKYASDIIDVDTFYKKITEQQVNYLLLKLTDNCKYKPFLRESDFETKVYYRRYRIKTDVIQNLLYQKTKKYPYFDIFESELNNFYNTVNKNNN
jgi:hypothetical protein